VGEACRSTKSHPGDLAAETSGVPRKYKGR
jgi:hypothetical protein